MESLQISGLKNYSYKFLNWDTKFFNVASGRLSLLNKLNKDEWTTVGKILNDYDFNVIDNINNDPDNALLISELKGAFVADINVQFEKKIIKTKQIEFSYNLAIENYKLFDYDMILIAENSFKHSRFYNDPYLDKNKSRLVYSEWVKNSFDKEDKFFVSYKEGNNTLGFLLFSINKSSKTAVIELIGVKSSYENRSIGKKMMKELEDFLIKKYPVIDLIKVGTQSKNFNALNFYQSCGFRMSEIRIVYHYWPNKN